MKPASKPGIGEEEKKILPHTNHKSNAKAEKAATKQRQCHYKGWYYTIWVILNKVKCTLKKSL